ncbi:hypothetical protein [Enterocloster clostridioformis]|uniref:hypothetical protein n=1 Tax=Enterocloster clostridioformis TaxID=1531 RepID=UPI0018AAEF4F|nr:hypothetical protein [Enterocloster clostridioformis]MDB2130691.1 hypothetical protein [Enterocloster clostridioformis]
MVETNNHFTVINGDKSKSEDKQAMLEQLYMKAFCRKVVAIYDGSDLNQCRDHLKRAVFYAVKYFSLERIDRRHCTEPRTLEQVNADFNFLECVKMLMGQLTPREMMSMFPIEKEYDGEKSGCKDYFYTIEKLKDFDLDKPLGEEGLENFLWCYWNDDLFAFDMVAFSIISNMYKAQTGRGIMEKWCEEQGIGTFTMNQELCIFKDNQTGEIHKLSKKPSHLKIVK